MVSGWDGLLEDTTATIGGLEVREFLVVSACVGLDPDPYAQVARESDLTFYCEVVSTHHLPAATWPIDEWALAASGWEPPVGRITNWSHEAPSARDAARLLIEALRFGRSCGDPELFVATIDRWPPPPRDEDRWPVTRPGPFRVVA